MPYLGAQASKSLTVIAPRVSLAVSPSPPWRAGQQITLVAKVETAVPENLPVRFDMILQLPVYATIGRAYTDAYGIARLTFTIPWRITVQPTGESVTVPCHTWGFRAVEESTGVESNIVSGAVAYPTRISISAPDKATSGETITVSGRLEYESESGVWSPLAGRTVSLYLNTSKIADVTTDSAGNYSKSFAVQVGPGTYTLKAVYAGEGLAAAAVAVLGITVPVEAVPPLLALAPIAAGGVIAALSR